MGRRVFGGPDAHTDGKGTSEGTMGAKNEKFRLRRAAFPALYYGANAVYQGYVSLYYTGLGFHGGQLGLISAATALASLAAQPLWGHLADRAKSQRLLLGMLCAASALLLLPAALGRGFIWQLAWAMGFYACFCALLPLGDAILLGGEGFGGYRLAGGLSFALAGALFGAARGRLAGDGVLWTAAGLLGLAAAAACLLPVTAGRAQRASVLGLLKDRELRNMLLFVLPLQMTMACFHTFHGPHFKALGGADWALGLGYLLSAVSEAPYLLLSGRIYRCFGAAKPMCIAAAVLALRWGILGLTDSARAALFAQLLHGGGFIVVTVSMAYWISDHVPREQKAGGQALLNMFTFGLARVPGSLLAGMLARRLGMGAAFLASAGLCALALVCFVPRAFGKGAFHKGKIVV